MADEKNNPQPPKNRPLIRAGGPDEGPKKALPARKLPQMGGGAPKVDLPKPDTLSSPKSITTRIKLPTPTETGSPVVKKAETVMIPPIRPPQR